MPRAKSKLLDDRASMAIRLALHADVAAGGLEWSEVARRMRQSLGMTQARFAQTFKLSRRLVVALEAGTANPTAETLARLGRPFGYRVGFIMAKPMEAK
jgi:putative transcriptional regulator